MHFCSSRYWIFNGQRSTLAECEIWLWRMWFPWSFSFYFSFLRFPERYGCSIFSATGITSFQPLYSRSAQNVDRTSNLPVTSNLLIFASFIQKYLQNIKKKNFKVFYRYNCRTSKKSARHRLAIFRCYVLIWLVRWSRHLVFNWGLLGNPDVLVLSEIRR